jgi:hypothetical protein
MKLSRSAVAQWESPGGSLPSSANLSHLAIELDCSFEWLATGRGSRQAGGKSAAQTAETAVMLRYFARDDAEEHVLAVFRHLDRKDQEVVMALADLLEKRSVSVKRRAKKD